MNNPTAIDVGIDGTVYVTAWESDNAFKIETDGMTTQIIDWTGDGVNGFSAPADFSIVVDDLGSVFVAGTDTDNVYKIVPEPDALLSLALGVLGLAWLRRWRARSSVG
jgi:hypothetical protein